MFKAIFISILVFISIEGYSQTDTITIMSYNLLNFPDGRDDCASNTVVPNRFDTLRKIIGYTNPDIFVACEIQNQRGADSILNRSLNIFGATNYTAAVFHNNNTGPSLQNMLYYNSDKLILQYQDVILTSVRDIDHYVLYSVDPNLSNFFDTTFIEVYMCHLKAGSTSTSQAQRDEQVTLLRDFIDTRPTDRNHFVCGDLNVYTSSEAAYQNLITGGINPLFDPINTPGNWNNNGSFSDVHTQSTRSSGSYDCGSSGGCDDRFDQILVSQNVLLGLDSLKYIPGTYDAVGNDGNHYNTNLLASPTNTQYPDSIVKALYYMSDHLPVVLKAVITFPTSNGLALNPSQTSASCFGIPDGSATVQVNAGQAPYSYQWSASANSQTTQTAINLPAGLHCVTITDALGEVDDVCIIVSQPNEIQIGTFPNAVTDNCNGIIYTLVSNGVEPYSYSWDDPLNQTTSNATDLCPGDYTITVTDAIGCQNSITITVNDNTNSLSELVKNQTSIYPNPFSTELILTSIIDLEDVTVKIINLLGEEKIVLNQLKINFGKEVVIDTKNLPSGYYFLELITNNSRTQKQLIKY